MGRVGTVVLAAGKGTRMKSRTPKVLHRVGGRAMLEHVLRAADAAVVADTAEGEPGASSSAEDDSSKPPLAVVVGHEREQVQGGLTWQPSHTMLSYVEQEPQLGTGDAVRTACGVFAESPRPPETILVLYGDTPLVRAETLSDLLAEHTRSGATITFLTAIAADPVAIGYGRILRDESGRVRGVVEQRHATAEELRIPEVNSGIYCFAAEWLWGHLNALEPHPNGEYYLTDLVDVAVREGQPVATTTAPLEETMGVNDRVALAEAERILRERTNRELMLAGVTLDDPATTYIEPGVRIGQDTIVYPGTTIRGATVIGAGCEIGPQSVIADSQIGDGCRVLASWVERAVMESGSRVGPMSHLRPGAHLKPGANVGNFAEAKNATLGEGVQMHHFSYLGDATVGAETNVGAGTITMNYDGREKHHTEIGARVFLGCDTLLKAPVTLGDGAATGGGAVVTRDVPAGKLVVGMPAREMRRVRSQPPRENGHQIETTTVGDDAPREGGARDGAARDAARSPGSAPADDGSSPADGAGPRGRAAGERE
ncbi:MAG TPA: bifunctional UDP-N-acetylglucosamine diphosphorylase/glucosamine-1-phosphate N-acetyltransferase GlmU [Ktedonobacterales bacterium]|nr:bifunctional UDP-N-acetylglucosamine diphosphorylase/glucosamine-1-phosphate N-acetyltransferase GlmU [Ktedonobacterales bacterium]